MQFLIKNEAKHNRLELLKRGRNVKIVTSTCQFGFYRKNLTLKDVQIFSPQNFSPLRKIPDRDYPHGHQ
jgi:hypothetical protein